MILNKIKINDTETVTPGVVYDISKATGQSYESLSDALSGNNVPLEIREGGMTVRFVSNSDNKYYQFRLMSDTFNTTPANWQGVDDVPSYNSKNLVKSGGVDETLYYLPIPLVLYDLSEPTEIISSQTGLLLRDGTINTNYSGYYFEIPKNESNSPIYIKFIPRNTFNNKWTNLCIYNNDELVSTKPIFEKTKEYVIIIITPGCSAKLVASDNKIYTSRAAIKVETRVESNLNVLKNQVALILNTNNYIESDIITVTGNGQKTYKTLYAPIASETTIGIKVTAISGSWKRFLFWCNNYTYRVKDRMVSGQLYEVVLTEDITSLGYYIETTGSVEFKIDVIIITSQQKEIDALSVEIDTLNNKSTGFEKITSFISNEGVSPISNTYRDAGAIFRYNGAIRTTLIPVNTGDEIITNANFDNSFGAVLYSANNAIPANFVRGISSTPTTHSIIVQEGEHYIIVSSRTMTGYDGNSVYVKVSESGKFYQDEIIPLENRISVLENRVDTEVTIFQDKCNRNTVYEQDVKNKFLWKKFDKAYFSWTNDDVRRDMYLYQDLCETYGFPYCPAVPFESVISNPTINGIELRTRLATILNNGGEILEHSRIVLNTANPYISDEAREQWYTYFRDGKRSSEKLLNTQINGLIKSGGSGEKNPEVIETQKWCLTYFNYANKFGDTPQFRLNRLRYEINENRTEEQAYQLYVAAIDDAVLNHKWLRLYCHGVEEVPITLLTRVFDYIKTKITDGDAAFVTWGYMYEHFKGSTLDKVVNPANYN